MDIWSKKSGLLKAQYRLKQQSQVLWNVMQSVHMLLLVAFLITTGCFLYLWQWMNYLKGGYHVQALEKEKAVTLHRLELLETEINFLSRPQRIESIAVGKIGMRPLTPMQYFTFQTSPHD